MIVSPIKGGQFVKKWLLALSKRTRFRPVKKLANIKALQIQANGNIGDGPFEIAPLSAISDLMREMKELGIARALSRLEFDEPDPIVAIRNPDR